MTDMDDEEWEDWYYDTIVEPKKKREQAYEQHIENEFERMREEHDMS